MKDENYEFNPETDLWVPGRRKFLFLGALGSVAAALGLSSVQEILKAVVPNGVIPEAIWSDQGLWMVKLDAPDHKFWFVDTGFKMEQRGKSHLEFWQETRRIVAPGEYQGSPGYASKVHVEEKS